MNFIQSIARFRCVLPKISRRVKHSHAARFPPWCTLWHGNLRRPCNRGDNREMERAGGMWAADALVWPSCRSCARDRVPPETDPCGADGCTDVLCTVYRYSTVSRRPPSEPQSPEPQTHQRHASVPTVLSFNRTLAPSSRQSSLEPAIATFLPCFQLPHPRTCCSRLLICRVSVAQRAAPRRPDTHHATNPHPSRPAPPPTPPTRRHAPAPPP